MRVRARISLTGAIHPLPYASSSASYGSLRSGNCRPEFLQEWPPYFGPVRPALNMRTSKRTSTDSRIVLRIIDNIYRILRSINRGVPFSFSGTRNLNKTRSGRRAGEPCQPEISISRGEPVVNWRIHAATFILAAFTRSIASGSSFIIQPRKSRSYSTLLVRAA